MTRKDYILLVKVINAYAVLDSSIFQFAQKLAEELKKENPKFYIDKFLTACGVETLN